jgi:hypothetical protein
MKAVWQQMGVVKENQVPVIFPVFMTRGNV